MPYIKRDRRVAVDPIIEGLVKRLRDIGCVRGDLNYTVVQTVLGSLKPATGWTYHSLSDCVSVLKDAATEIERRLLGPYEDGAAAKNGDCSEIIQAGIGCKFEIKDGEKLNSFKALESRYAPNWDAPNAICGVVVDSPLMEVSKTIYKQVKEDSDDDVTDIA